MVWSPQTFPISCVVISPYWDDIDLSESGGVYYSSFTPENGAGVLEHVQAFLMKNQSVNFTAKSVIVIKWMNVCPYGDSLCNYVSRVNSYNYKIDSSKPFPIIISILFRMIVLS